MQLIFNYDDLHSYIIFVVFDKKKHQSLNENVQFTALWSITELWLKKWIILFRTTIQDRRETSVKGRDALTKLEERSVMLPSVTEVLVAKYGLRWAPIAPNRYYYYYYY